jgi:DNA-binding MarR family transcriptional regulator
MHSYEEYLNSPLFWLRRTFLVMHRAVAEEMNRYELTTAQFEVLRHLWQQDGMEQRTLQERLGVTSPTLTGVVDTLVERGLIERRLSPEDARVRQLFLLPDGRAMEHELGNAMERVQNRLLEGFSPAEQSLLRDWLRRMALNLGATGEGCD